MRDALTLIDKTRPDVAVVDIALKSGSGIEVIKRGSERNATTRFLVWSTFNESLYAERALAAGAAGYITKEQATEQIIGALRTVLQGKLYLSDTMIQRLMRSQTSKNRAKPLFPHPEDCLSDRELDVLRLVGEGRTISDIAQRLKISPKSVETYRTRIKEKLNRRNTHELLLYAIQWHNKAIHTTL